LPFTCAGRKYVVFEELGKYDNLTSSGPKLNLAHVKVHNDFLPHVVTKTITDDKGKVKERIAVAENVFVFEWQTSNLRSARLEYGLPFFKADYVKRPDGFIASVEDQVFVAMSVVGANMAEVNVQNDPFSFSAELNFPKNKRIYLIYVCGYSKANVLKQLRDAAKKPASIFAQAHEKWDNYFQKVVPRFDCSDKKLEKLYYYQAYATRVNLYDIPYEPFTHPYTSPWKSGAKWQWSWNTPMNSVTEKWLNDKQIASGGIELLGTNGGALGVGTYLRPVKHINKSRNAKDMNKWLGELRKDSSKRYDPTVVAVMPHSMPSGLVAAYELFLCSGDKVFLGTLFDIMIEAESNFSKYELPNGLCTTTFVDEYDYSLRLKPFIKAFTKGDPAMMTKMDTPFIPIDYNCYLYALRQRIIDIAAMLSMKIDSERFKAKVSLLKNAIQQYLWSEKDGFYYDADPRTMKRSGVKCIGGIAAPLYTGIADQNQAARIVAEHLTNPKEFGTPYPCPSISVDAKDIDPSLFTYGGDCLITSGIWFTIEGLIRYGYVDLANRYILKTIKMLTKNGLSSAYSYNCFTGNHNHDDPFVENHVLASQSLIVTDLICKYLIGIVPQKNGSFVLSPISLPESGISDYVFGPYKFCDKQITVKFCNGKHQIFINSK
jgi:hypothetical protein